MAFKVFLDANFLLDLLLKRSSRADEIIQMALSGELKLFTTPAILHIAGYYTTKAYGVSQAKQLLLTLLNDVEIIDCDHQSAIIALNSNMVDIEDALQYYTALKFGMEYFISEDKELKKAGMPRLPVYTTVELLGELRP